MLINTTEALPSATGLGRHSLGLFLGGLALLMLGISMGVMLMIGIMIGNKIRGTQSHVIDDDHMYTDNTIIPLRNIAR